jgi:hypothetical protein
MATSFNIQGPTSFGIKQLSETSEATHDVLGHTDNDDLISVDFNNIYDPYESSESGREPAAMIYQGTIATITATLVKWDTAIKDNLHSCVWDNSGDHGLVGTVGQDQFNTTFTHVENLQVLLTPTSTSGMETYTYRFFKCWVDNIQETGWGNAPKKLVLSIRAVRNSNGRLFKRT